MKAPAFKSGEPAETETSSGTPFGVQFLSFLCGLVVIVLGAKSTLQDYRIARKLTGLDAFVETPGRFLKVEVRNDTLGGPDEFHPDILYEYFVDGRSVWGWRLSYEEEPRSRGYWKERLAGYREGLTVPVYYNPDEPKDSIVEKKTDGLYRTIMKMLLGGLFLLAGVILAVLPAAGWIRKAITRA
jgi:hypothetical protein